MSAQRTGRWTRLVPAGYSLLLTLLITAPLLRPGYLLLRDAVSTPRSYPTDAALGLGDAAPRAVPQDALLAALSPLIDGGLLVKVVLLAALWAAGYGAAVLVRELLGAPHAAQLVATTLVVWNPYIAERLLQGHWSLLTGYAALPWTALAALRLRTAAGRTRFDRFRDWTLLAGCLAAAGLTPTGALLATVVAVTVAGWRRAPGVTALALLACAPWLVATAVSGVAAEPSDPAGVTAFAARAEPWLATVGSLAGLGGIWNAEAVPVSRTTPLAAVATILLLAVVLLGVRRVAAPDADPDRTRTRRILLVLAVTAVLVPALAATPAGLTVMEWLVVEVPGAGLLRDTQKYVALAAPGYALCAGAACLGFGRLGAKAGTRGDERPDSADDHGAPARWSPGLAALFIGVLALPLIDLGWGVGGQLRTIEYPASWQEIAERVDGPGDIAVLPGGMFRRFPYTGSAPVLDPAPRLLPRDVLQTGALPVRGATVTGEGARAQTVENLLLDGGPADELAQLGVGWVLVERDTPGPLGNSAATLAQLAPVHSTGELALYRVPDVRPRPAPEHRSLVVAAHILWALLLVTPLAVRASGFVVRKVGS
ncbi:hypothetical protein NLM24_07185 [Nocardia zapadnayensis]|uniref:hypothetical protein n=1 Tax=Nocardia rhamnosiphila TaxID=426716 RepID=UPI0022479FA1|nr:hypothetical protein [Nocardia zapadnayensis]MCX0270491.1 hypothetical protein [Nocardia zapadnayensis]